MSVMADLAMRYLDAAHARAERITKLLAQAKSALSQGRPAAASKHVSDAIAEVRAMPVYMRAASEALERLLR